MRDRHCPRNPNRPGTLPITVISGSPQKLRMMTAGSVKHLLIGELVSALRRPVLISSGSEIALVSLLGRRLGRRCWIAQSIHISNPDSFGQSGRHFPLQLLPKHAAVTAALGEPRDGLLIYHTFTGIAHLAPSCQVLSVGFILPLLAICQLLRAVWPRISAGEVGDESLGKIEPAIDGILRQVIQPEPRRTFQHLRYVPHSLATVSAGDIHRGANLAEKCQANRQR